MSWTIDLLTGMAEHLAAAGAGVWRPDGSAYGPDEVAIVIRSIPQTPDRLITLAPYAVDGTGLRGLADHQAAVQIRIRGTTDPRTCDETADAVFDALDSLAGVSWHGVPIVQVWRQSYTSLGQDDNNRWQASHNYYLDVMRPTAHNTD